MHRIGFPFSLTETTFNDNCQFIEYDAHEEKLNIHDINWGKIKVITSSPSIRRPVKVKFDIPHTARYIKLKGYGQGRLILDEVEIY